MRKFTTLKLFSQEKLSKVSIKLSHAHIHSKTKYYTHKTSTLSNLGFQNNSKVQMGFIPMLFAKRSHSLISCTNKDFSTNNQPNSKKVPAKKEKEVKADFKQIRNVIWPLFKAKHIKRLLMYSAVMTVCSKLMITASPYFLKLCIDSIIAKQSVQYSCMFIALFGVNRIFGSAFYEWRQVILNRLTNFVIIDFSHKMMEYLMKMEHIQFKHNTQEVLSKFEKALRGIESINRFLIGSLLSNTIEFAIVSTMLWACCGKYYLINTVFVYSFYLVITKIMSKTRNKILQERWKEEIRAESKLSDTVYNMDTVKFFQNEAKEIENYTDIVKSVRDKAQKTQTSLAKLNVAQSFIISTGMIVNLGMGVFDCYKGKMTPGDLAMLNVIYNQVMTPLNFMGALMREVDETRVNLNFTIEMINKRESIIKEQNLPDFCFRGGKIEFKDVTYGYSLNNTDQIGKIILNNLNVNFEPGSINAIVGHSGNGKSTIFNLIYKLIDPKQGTISVDGQNLNEIGTSSYRDVINHICPQNGYLFNSTIFNNIAYGKREANMDEVVEIAKAVNMHNIIERFPEQYNSNVGTLGAKLSGGEKQRLLLARAFLKKAQILMLDEPTSNLDNENEKLIMDYIFKNYRDKTVIISAHKLNTVINCDRIHVLHNGVIHEQGTHKDLISKKENVYHELFEKNSHK